MRAARLLLFSAIASCSSVESKNDPQPPGVAVDNCPETELPIVGGGCHKVGARECGPGFAFDEDRGCNPILPASPCGPGTMAVPGDSACHPVSSCGEGTWGSIPVAAGAVFVDASYTGGASDGSAGKPFRTIQAAIDVASPGYVVAVAAGTYAEDVKLNRRVKLWGRCAEKVSIVGSATFALDITVDGEVHGIAVTGPDTAIGLAGARVIADSVWVHDAGGRGIDLEDVGGSASLTLRNSLVEGSAQIGIYAEGSNLTIERSVVRGTRGATKGEITDGVIARAGEVTHTPSQLKIVSSLIDDNTTFGINVFNSTVEIDGSVIRGTRATGPSNAAGITVQNRPELPPPELTLTRSLIDTHQGVGIDVAGANFTIDTVTIRDIDANDGGGMLLENATGKVVNTTLVDIGGAGINVTSSNVEISRTRIARIVFDPSGASGPGLQLDSDHGYPSEVTVSEVLLRDIRSAAVGVFGSRMVATDIAVIGVQQNQSGVFGDGIALSSVGWKSGEVDVVDATITRAIVRETARAGVAVFGGTLRLGQSVICSPIDINTERVYGFPEVGAALERDFVVEDLSGNVCGCGTKTRCSAKSAGLLPLKR